MTEEDLLKSEEDRLSNTKNDSESANILYNIIKLNNKLNQQDNNYRNTKLFIDKYVNSLKSADYGYDNFNYNKINQLIDLLTPEEQESILQYIISVTAREFPEHDRNWFVTRKHNAEIRKIIHSNLYVLYPKIILLYFGQSIQRLLLGFLGLFIITSLILLPAPIEVLAILNITFENFNDTNFLNHILNVFSLFAGLDNNLQIKPVNWLGLFLIIFGKLFFITFISNFIYFKISDKITQK